jgi:hypothetical protein
MSSTQNHFQHLLLFLLTGICCFHSAFAQDVSNQQNAQLYGIFNNVSTLETRIVPIINDLKIQLTKTENAGFSIPDERNAFPGNEWYGSASLAGDPRTGQLFYADKSGTSISLWGISTKGKHAKINAPVKNIKGYCFTKMAMSPDGYVYAISTKIDGQNLSDDRETLVIRFKPCNNPGCTSIETIGYIPGKGGFKNSLTYSGDMAFSAAGDLFLFGTELDTAINYYKGAHIYKISANQIKKKEKPSIISIQYIGQIAGMGVKTGIDSTVITGVAFEQNGSFVIAAMDKYTGTRVHFYRGKSLSEITDVAPVQFGYNMPPGFVISDLASFNLPVIAIKTMAKSNKINQGKKNEENDWEKLVTITRAGY